MPTSDDSIQLNLTAEIVSAFVSNNSVPVTELPALIKSVHAAWVRIVSVASAPAEPITLVPVVSIRSSLKPDFLICLDDGKKFKSLKRHLSTLGMTPDQYRAKWNLQAEYPMVAPNYSAQRSELAKKNGLGQKGGHLASKMAAKSKTDKPKRARSSKASKESPAA